MCPLGIEPSFTVFQTGLVTRPSQRHIILYRNLTLCSPAGILRVLQWFVHVSSIQDLGFLAYCDNGNYSTAAFGRAICAVNGDRTRLNLIDSQVFSPENYHGVVGGVGIGPTHLRSKRSICSNRFAPNS